MRTVLLFSLAIALSLGFNFYVFAQGRNLNALTPAAARDLFNRAGELMDKERYEEAAAALQKAIALAPDYLRAHADYVRVKSYYLNKESEVKAEYEALMAKEPQNPVYPMALALGQMMASTALREGLYKKVTELAPEWAWSHYAKAQLVQAKEPETALAELLKMVEIDNTSPQPYAIIISLQERRLNKIDDAIATAERMLSNPDLRLSGLSHSWRLRLAKDRSQEAKAKLKDELNRMAEGASDLKLLTTIRSTYANVLKDEQGAAAIEEKIRALDPTWYEERGSIAAIIIMDANGPRRLTLTGRQMAIYNKLGKIALETEAGEQMTRLEALLKLGPEGDIKKMVKQRLFGAAQRSGDIALITKYGEALLAENPEDPQTLSTLAVALANKKDLPKALEYARRAERAAAEFRLIQRPEDIDERLFNLSFSEEKQKAHHNSVRAAAVGAHGRVLYQMGKYDEAEAKLRQSVELSRSEASLNHLAEALRKLDRGEEADRLIEEARNEWANSIKRRFTNTPSKDFTLETLDGRKVKLSDLKGKVVLVDFWATWCKPCVQEMPALVALYNKYKERGFEILAITVDEKGDRDKVVSFVKEHKAAFPVMFDDGVTALYGVDSFPTSIFIDRQGNVRFKHIGYGEETARSLDLIVGELLK